MGIPAYIRAAVGLLAFTSSLAVADICADFQEKSLNVETPLSIEYESELQKHWSAACSAMRPACILAPNNTEEVAEIVAALHETTDQFAIKSGGHMPNNGFASIDGGILISTKNLDQVIYDSESQTVVAGPGQTWGHLQEGFAESGRTVVGGRMSDVGVGGYTLGGGLGFLSTQYGWAVNSLVDVEVVLANGTVVNANDSSNPDLFAALKGSGNNLGIVTAFTFKTHPMEHEVWGGNWVFTADKAPELIEAVQEFVNDYPDDKAAIIMTAEKLVVADIFIMFLFYDGIEPPAGVFDKFKAIGPFSDTTKRQPYIDLVNSNNQFILQGQRYLIATETTPLAKDNKKGAEALLSYYEHWKETTKSVIEIPGLVSSMAFQPMPQAITKKSKDAGGDLMDLDPEHNYIVLEYNFSYLPATSDRKADSALQEIYSGTRNMIQKDIDDGLLPDAYLPLFMNDAYYRQEFWERNRNAEFVRSVREDVDPEKFWQERTSGGWRIG